MIFPELVRLVLVSIQASYPTCEMIFPEIDYRVVKPNWHSSPEKPSKKPTVAHYPDILVQYHKILRLKPYLHSVYEIMIPQWAE